MSFKLPKNERLHSEKLIKELFEKGSSFFLFPFKVFYLDAPEGHIGTYQVLFSVSKKRIKKAVDRNVVKRRMKEAYRLSRHLMEENTGRQRLIALIYVSNELSGFHVLLPKMQSILKKLNHAHSHT